MPSTFFGLNIGTTGLYTYQAALNTTAHNISNAETKGYSRQVLNQKAGIAVRVNSSYGMAGAGVDVSDVTQQRNIYYDHKYWKNSTIYGEYSSKEHYMDEIQTYLNEVTLKGFTTSFNTLNDNLQELQKNPSSDSVRKQVVSYAQGFSEYFNYITTNMRSIQEECNSEIKNQVDRINSIAKQVAGLNKQINILEGNGGTANDLRDERALLIDELSEIANVSVQEEQIGECEGINSYTVKIDGETLIDTNEFYTLVTVPREDRVNQNDIDGLFDIKWSNGQDFDIGSNTLGGNLKAIYEVRDGNNGENLCGKISGAKGDTVVKLTDTNVNEIEKLNIPSTGSIKIGNVEYSYTNFTVTKAVDPVTGKDTGKYEYTFQLDKGLVAAVNGEASEVGKSITYKGIPYYMGQLNEFVRNYAKAFNNIHKTGLDKNGKQGTDFFNGGSSVSSFSTTEDYRFLTASNFQVNDAIYDDPDLIAATDSISSGVEESEIIKSLIALKNDSSMFKQGTPASFLQNLVGDVGIDTDAAKNFSKSQNDILSMINYQRLSVSGVDTEEEAINMIRYQNAYNLSSKAISVLNEIYDNLINRMGL